VDLNRAGVGLIELVSEPEIESPLEASQFVQKVHEALQDVGVSSGNMEEGAMRIDVNVNWICADSQAPVSPRVELKNISGIGIIGDAVQAELDRQQHLIRQNVLQHAETRVYMPQSNITLPLRSKQFTQTYRYLPEYDLPEYPIGIELIDSVKTAMPLTRQVRIQNLLNSKDSLNRDHLERLWSSPTNNLPDLFEACINLNCQDPRFLLNWCTNELLALLNRQDRKLEKLSFTPVAFVALVESVRTGQLDKELAKQEMSLAITQDRDVKQMTEPPLQNNNQKSNYSLIDDEIVQLFKSHPDRIKFLTSAEGRVRGSVDFFVGPLLKKFRGRVKASELIERLKWHLYNNNK
jgi:aspartyl-tRNA(Asn)/glutamyl-tRNA(Gln) amidotransferase subunit B